MLEGEKNNLQANTRKKKFIVNQGVEKKIHDQTKSPTPPPPSPLRSRMVGPLHDLIACRLGMQILMIPQGCPRWPAKVTRLSVCPQKLAAYVNMSRLNSTTSSNYFCVLENFLVRVLNLFFMIVSQRK